MRFQTSTWLFTLSLLATMSASGEALTKKKTGRAPDPNLKIKQSGVPQLELYQKKSAGGKTDVVRIKNIPRIDIGEEETLKATSLVPTDLPEDRRIPKIDVKTYQSPEPVSIEKYLGWKADLQAPDPKIVSDPHLASNPVPLFVAPTEAAAPVTSSPELAQTPIKDLSPAELKLLQALIFLEIQKNYPMALGLFAELLDEAPEYRVEATYNLARTGRGLGLYSEYRFQMLKVLSETDPEWQKKAVLSLVQNAGVGDLELVQILDPKIEKLNVNYSNADQYQINRAKYYLEKDQLKVSLEALDQISMKSKHYNDAQFLKTITQYRLGMVNEAIAVAEVLLGDLEKTAPQSDLKSMTGLTLGRLYFQTGEYKKSFGSYLKVDKTHPEWPQAMIEQAWSQILSGDYEGAAGNMYSLHTDFFKNTFAPESYIVRSVSYLNLCQFGDGAKVVSDLKRRYSPIQKKMEAYQTAHTDKTDYYETVKTFLKDAEAREIDGLPRTFVWSLARTPAFVTEQRYINSLEDQVSRYNRITMDLINREKFLLAEQSKIRNQIIEQKKKLKAGEKTLEITNLEKRLLSFKVQHFIVKKARSSIKEIRSAGLNRVEKEKLSRKQNASEILSSRMKSMETSLSSALDQTDVLQYELYAGAGEHLRYQASGGDIDPRESAGLKPEENKQLKWDYKGEVWEDELGHYRSSLKNVCPEIEGTSQEKVSAIEQGVSK